MIAVILRAGEYLVFDQPDCSKSWRRRGLWPAKCSRSIRSSRLVGLDSHSAWGPNADRRGNALNSRDRRGQSLNPIHSSSVSHVHSISQKKCVLKIENCAAGSPPANAG
jgi:hypothetical protein